MKYTTYRFWFKYGNEDDPIECTTKEWDSLDKAINYAHRYATGIKFESVEIEDKNGRVVYRITSNGVVEDFRNDSTENNIEVVSTPAPEAEEIKPLKIKKYGKNKVVFKKLVLDEETRIENENGIDCKSIFKNLIGFEFLSERVKDKIKITGFDGESFFIKTRLPVEVT